MKNSEAIRGALNAELDLFPTQLKFAQCEERFPAFIGGYGAGKTYVNSVKAILQATVHNPGLAGLLVAPTYRDLRDTNIPTLIELLNKHGIEYQLVKSTFDLILPWWKTRILLRSADDPEKLKGPNVAWAGIDEVARVHEDIWGVLVSRVRIAEAKMKQTFATGTPEGLNWVYDKWVENSTDGYQLFQASTAENVAVGADYLAALTASHDEDELKQKLHGEFTEGSKGRAYKFFSRQQNLSSVNPMDQAGRKEIITELPLCITCDFNIDPCVWLVVQHFRGTIYVADEIVLRDTSTLEMLEELESRGYKRHRSGLIVYGDPSGNSRRTVASQSDYSLMREAGLDRQNVARSAPSVKDRIVLVNSRLREREDGAVIRIHPRCKNLIKDMERVKWQVGAVGVLDKRDLELTHASDALGYFVHREYAVRRKPPGRMKIADAIRQ
jgi:hypothetical protein